jgi:hypothetical protein
VQGALTNSLRDSGSSRIEVWRRLDLAGAVCSGTR